MKRTCFFISILLCVLFTAFDPVTCRRYDIETEAVKLFGEDLKVVLKRFRRTPEYMAILNEKVVELKRNFDDMLKQVSSAYKVKMEKHIQKTLEQEQHKKTYHMQGRYRPERRQRPQGGELQADPTTLSPVEQLDRMVPGNDQLSAAESNHYRDLGFQFAGDAIHNIISNMRDDDAAAAKSTRSPDDTAPTTTEHVKVHEVSTRGPEVHEEPTRPEPEAVSGHVSEAEPEPPKYIRHAYKQSTQNKGSYNKMHHLRGIVKQTDSDTARLKAASDRRPREKSLRIKGPHDMKTYGKEVKDSKLNVKRDVLINSNLLPEKIESRL